MLSVAGKHGPAPQHAPKCTGAVRRTVQLDSLGVAEDELSARRGRLLSELFAPSGCGEVQAVLLRTVRQAAQVEGANDGYGGKQAQEGCGEPDAFQCL